MPAVVERVPAKTGPGVGIPPGRKQRVLQVARLRDPHKLTHGLEKMLMSRPAHGSQRGILNPVLSRNREPVAAEGGDEIREMPIGRCRGAIRVVSGASKTLAIDCQIIGKGQRRIAVHGLQRRHQVLDQAVSGQRHSSVAAHTATKHGRPVPAVCRPAQAPLGGTVCPSRGPQCADGREERERIAAVEAAQHECRG